MSNLSKINADPKIGPLYVKPLKKGSRVQYAPEHGETCSLTDRIFQDNSSLQRLNKKDYIYKNPHKTKKLPDTLSITKKYSEMIEEHIERRVLFFFQQLIVCYQTKLHFESIGAQVQGKSASNISMKVKDHLKKHAVRNAAHSSGNPCLIAYNKAKWEKYQQEKTSKPNGFIFLKDTDYYRTCNATMNMPKWINEADREIDEKKKDSLLRKKGEKLINQSAQGLISPDKGIVKYIQKALKEIQKAQQRLESKNPEIKKVLNYYAKNLKHIQTQIKTQSSFLENFLNLKMGVHLQNKRSKHVILQIRYAAIRNCQINQSALIQKITNLQKKILAKIKKENGNRQPNYFCAAFKTVFIEQAKTNKNRQRLEKLLNFSYFNFEKQIQSQTGIYNKTKGLIAVYSAKINSVAKQIIKEMRILREKEKLDRSKTLKKLRTMQNWSQKQLGMKINQLFPNVAASQSTISRIENQKKLVSEKIAMGLSQVFKIDLGLFMPYFYYN